MSRYYNILHIPTGKIWAGTRFHAVFVSKEEAWGMFKHLHKKSKGSMYYINNTYFQLDPYVVSSDKLYVVEVSLEEFEVINI